MIIELYPEINNTRKNELYDFLERAIVDNSKLQTINIKKTKYVVLFSENGFYEILNNRVKSINIEKKCIIEPIKIVTKTKKDYNIFSFRVNYIIDEKIYSDENVILNHIPYYNILHNRSKYELTVNNNSSSKCEIIFDDKNKLIDCVFYVSLPNNKSHDIKEITYFIKECIENTKEKATNMYNDDFYSLFSIIGNML